MKFYSSFPITPENCLINRAINYGDGLFETIHISNGEASLWSLHFQRLTDGLKVLGMDEISEDFLYSKIKSLFNDGKSYIAKVVVFRDDSKRGYSSESRRVHFFISVYPYIQSETIDTLTVSPILLSNQNQLAGLKHLNRLEQVLAGQKLNSTKYSDAIMLNKNHNIVETINKNILLIKNNKLYTPKLNKCGVYGVALRWLEQQGFELNWKKIEFKSIQKYDGMMVCNSVQGFTSITNIDNKIKFPRQPLIAEKIIRHWKNFK